MPTGYTSRIADGIEFKDFVMQCARAFGALVTMRDDPFDAPVPDEFKPSSYEKSMIDRNIDRKLQLQTMTDEEAEIESQKQYEKEKASNQKYIDDHKILKLKYELMLEKVRAWTPPTKDHEELKRFMTEQIQSSIRGDCDISYWEGKTIYKMSGKDWRERELNEAVENIAYYNKKYAEELERCKQRTAWVRALKESLK